VLAIHETNEYSGGALGLHHGPTVSCLFKLREKYWDLNERRSTREGSAQFLRQLSIDKTGN
jgi:hypothetical protein